MKTGLEVTEVWGKGSHFKFIFSSTYTIREPSKHRMGKRPESRSIASWPSRPPVRRAKNDAKDLLSDEEMALQR